METFSHPRWEDYEYTYVNLNPFGWFGNGWTQNELDRNINVDYLNEENVDFPLSEQISVIGNGHTAERQEEPVVNGVYTSRL
jgi:hypothetical protein